MMNVFRWIITLLVCTLAITGLYFYKGSLVQAKIAQAQSMPEPSATVESTRPLTADFQQTTKVTGEVQAYRQQVLSNEMAGKIVAVHFNSGDRVEKDQLLIELNHSEETARLEAAKARHQLADKTLLRYHQLRQQNRISIEAYDQAQANVQIAKADVSVLQSLINKKRLRSPFAAHAGIHNLSVGEFIDTNTQITTLIGINEHTWIDFDLPQTVPELDLGSEVTIIPHDGLNQSGKPLTATIIAKNPMLFADSRNLRYRVQLSRELLPAKPLTLVNVEVPVTSVQTVMTVPDLAISRDQFGDYVFLLEETQPGTLRAKRQKVTLGTRQADRVIVLDGLDGDAIIAAKGAFKLFDGMRVYVAPTDASADPSTNAS